MIDRKALLERNAPHLTEWRAESPLTVGNGEIAFTADVTGLQTFYEEQEKACVPLCTMSQWGWHSTPAGEKRDRYYDPGEVVKTPYESVRGTVSYASEVQPGNEEIYHWLRENPHRLNLIRITFLWEGREISPEEIREVQQSLDLSTGILRSRFEIQGRKVETETLCAGSWDILGFSIRSEALAGGSLSAALKFPYGYKGITASDWEHPEWHETTVRRRDSKVTEFERRLDRDRYLAGLQVETEAELLQEEKHVFVLKAAEETLTFTIALGEKMLPELRSFDETKKNSRETWKAFWEKAGMIDLHRSEDSRWRELERRLVLSEYLLAVQSLGSAPPQETGLTCNSWYGKFHLEMYPWHCAWAALWNVQDRLEDSLRWYKTHLKEARENAACNGYRGARWPKMVDRDAIDSPSSIATLLIWQQPHILWMLSLYSTSLSEKPGVSASEGQKAEEEFLREYRDVICETAQFMADFVYWNEKTKCYDLPSPFIPAQEEHDPRKTRNAAYELEYWSFALHLAADWADRFGWDKENWREIADHMAPLPTKDGVYLACETCPDTFTEFAKDHPSMTACFGLLPGKRVDPEVMRATLDKVLECWDYPTMWGWDFAMLAMTAVRLHLPEKAMEILLMDTPKNAYVASGNNYQRMRNDLPLYLPGNGSLLLAAAMMTAGYEGCEEPLPGFPKDGSWTVEYENIRPYPYEKQVVRVDEEQTF